MNGGAVDVPAKSWGIYLGIVEGRIKHIILAQNSFCFTVYAFDLDYTAILVVHLLIANALRERLGGQGGRPLGGSTPASSFPRRLTVVRRRLERSRRSEQRRRDLLSC